MDILVICQYYYPESFTITSLCEALVRLGHKVQVVTSQPQYGFYGIPKEYRNITDEVIAGVNIHRVKTSPRKKTKISILLNYFGFYWRANQYVKKVKQPFDIVFSMSLSPIFSILPGVTYAKKNHIPHLLYAVDVWPESLVVNHVIKKPSHLYNLMNQWSQKVYASVDRILVGSPSFYRYFRLHHHLVHVEKQALIQPALKIFEGTLITKKKTLTLVYTGNAGTLHRLDLFLQALKYTDQHVQFYCIGHGSQTQTLKHLTKQYALEARVKFIPFLQVEQLAKYVDDADVCLVSLVAKGIIGKTIPQKLVQYLAWGKPILAILEGDGANLLKTTQGGLVVKPEVKAIVNAIKKLQRLTSAQRQTLGQRNRDYYQQHLHVDIAAKTIEHHCTDLIKLNKSKLTTPASK